MPEILSSSKVAAGDAERKSTMKRGRSWFTTAFVVMATVMVELDCSVAFSPASEAHANINGERRRSKRPGQPRIADDESLSHRTVARGTTDLKVALSTDMLNMYKTSHNVKVNKSAYFATMKTKDKSWLNYDFFGWHSSKNEISVGTRNRGSRMVVPRSRVNTPKVEKSDMALDHDGLLDKSQEEKLAVSIRNLRRVVTIRDTLVDTSESVPTEAEWAEACNLSVIGLRRAMYEGQQARTILVSANAGLVTSIAKRYFASLKYASKAGGGVGTILTIQDLIQEGNLGLMEAAERFDVDRGFRFSTYATYWIRQRILHAISDSSRIIRLPAHVYSMLQKINKAKRYVSQEIGRTPSILELAQYLEVPVDELERYTTRTRHVISLESPLRSGSSIVDDRRTIGDLLVSDAPTPEEDAQREYLKEDIRAVINALPTRERDVLIFRFGLENGAPMTASETARHLGISVDRVRLVEGRALNKLRNPQRNYRLKEYIQEPVETEQVKEEVPSSAEKIWFF